MTIYNETMGLLKQVFQTENDLFLVPASGSALMDMAYGSLLGEGETVVVGVNGFFGQRLRTIATAHGLRTVPFTAPHGQPLDPDKLRRVLVQEPEARAVTVVHHETATTVLNPLRELATVAQEAGVPIIVDAISSLGGVPLPVDEWGIGVCVSVANKCLECPPGLAFISVGPQAWEWVDRSAGPTHGWYLDLRTWRHYAAEWTDWHPYPVTLPTNNILGLRRSLHRILDEEGLEGHYTRIRTAAQTIRQGLRDLGFEMLVDAAFAAPVATAVCAHPEFAVGELTEYLAQEHSILVSVGLGPLAGKVFRVGHMGKASTEPYLKMFLSAVEAFMVQRGLQVPAEAR
jgi:alanine-glyoxylate transaminase/serine-glyoxylate transaminase/serine-pyruvate transaminase